MPTEDNQLALRRRSDVDKGLKTECDLVAPQQYAYPKGQRQPQPSFQVTSSPSQSPTREVRQLYTQVTKLLGDPNLFPLYNSVSLDSSGSMSLDWNQECAQCSYCHKWFRDQEGLDRHDRDMSYHYGCKHTSGCYAYQYFCERHNRHDCVISKASKRLQG